MFVSQLGAALVAGGGLDQDGKPAADVFVLAGGRGTNWQRFELTYPVAFSAAVSGLLAEDSGTAHKLFLAGGLAKGGLTARVQVLQRDNSQLRQSELPPLPQAVALAGAGFFEDQAQKQLYIVGGTTSAQGESASRNIYRWSFAAKTNPAWESLPPLPGAGRLLPGVLCFYNDLHVFGGYTVEGGSARKVYAPTAAAAAYRWKPIDGTLFTGWRALAPLPVAVAAPVVFQTGQVHAGVAGGFVQPFTGQLLQAGSLPGLSQTIVIYHNVTDTWVEKGKLPEPMAAGSALRRNGGWLFVGGTGQETAYAVSLNRTVKSLAGLDYFFLIGYFVLVALAGIWYAHRQRSTESFALGDRKVPWWMAGISMFATGASSISFMAIPAQAFRTSLLWGFKDVILIPLFFLEAYVIYPLIRKLSLTSTYEYLERRFHPSLRYIASAQCIALQVLGRMNMVLLLPALAIAAVTGLDVVASVLLMGVVTTIYTTKGGLKAVILTEVIQGITMIIGVSLMIFLAIGGLRGGTHDFVEINRQFHRFDYAIWSFDYTAPIVWMVILTPILTKFAFASDQPVVQRVFATPLRDVRKLAAMFLVCSVFISLAVNLAGISIFAYFRQHPAELDPAMTNDQVIPLYIIERLPVGMAGLIIAALFAAAASALAGSMNSVATIFTEDFYRKLNKHSTDRQRLLVMRLASIASGLVATGCAIYMAKMNMRSLFQTWNELFALLGGGFLGVYILGIFTHRANAIGAISGALASIAVTILVKKYTALHWYGYMPAAVFSCMLIGYVISLVTPRQLHDLRGLTVFDINGDLSGEDTPGAQPQKETAGALKR